MRIKLDIECTPEEVRRVLGLPDITRVNEAVTAEMERGFKEVLAGMEPEALMKAWMPAGTEGFERLREMLWPAMGSGRGKGDGGGDDGR